MLRRFIAGSLVLAAAAISVAGPQTYASRVQPIRAGVVILDSAHPNGGTQGDSIAPFAFYNLSVNNGVKPVGWNVFNPHAPSRVTQDTILRFGTAGLNKAGAPTTAGAEITKRDAPYWEVFLDDASTSDLADYDILLVAPKSRASLTPTEREKLRSFVDHGGILWIDPSALPYGRNGVDPVNNFPVSFELRNVGVGTDLSDFTHPLLSRPFKLSGRDVNVLNNGLPTATLTTAIDAINGTATDITGVTDLYASSIASFFTLRPVVLSVASNTKYETMGVAQIGDGYVVVTARAAAAKLNRPSVAGLSYVRNTAYSAMVPAALEQDGQAAAKLVVNMLSMLSEFRQQGGGTHKSGGSQLTLEAPLLTRGHDTSVTFTGDSNGAVLYKGMVIAAVQDGGSSHLVAYDPNPGRDLDNDGNANDGYKLDNPGSGADIIWRSPNLQGPISMPVVAEIPDSGVGVDQVLVIDANGALHGYNPVARIPGSQSLSGADRVDLFTPITPPNPARFNDGNAPAPPTIHEGLAYIADTIQPSGNKVGRIWVANLRTGTRMASDQPWYLGGGSSPFQSQPIRYSPTIGYIPIQDNSGGTDKVMYVPMELEGTSPAGVLSIWLGARGEKPANPPTMNGSDLQVETRASQQGGLPVYVRAGGVASLNPHLTVLNGNGVPFTAQQMQNYFTGNVSESSGILSFSMRANRTLPIDAQVRVDYNIDMGDGSFQGVAESIKRGPLQLPDVSGQPVRKITGPVALTAKGSIFVAVSDGRSPALFGFKEEGRGNFRCTMRYELNGPYKFNGQGRPQDSFPPVVEDHDPVINFAPGVLSQPFSSFAIIGGPSVRNDQVFISALGMKGLIPTMVLMAFASEPETPRFRIDNVPDGSVLVQPDVARSNGAIADVPTVLPSSSYQWDADTHILRIDNLMNIPKGQIQQCISLSQPFYLRTPGGSDVPLVPDSIPGASWSPLLWYHVVNGYSPRTGPVVTGDNLFVGGNSGLINGLTNGNFTAVRGMLYAIRSSISPNDDYLKITPGRPWLKQLWSLNYSGVISANPDVKWPQMAGVTSIPDYIIRLNQTSVGNSLDVSGIAAGDGTFVALGSNGLYTYNRADLVIADQNRVSVFDGSGNPVWSTSSSADVGANGSAGNVHPLVNPTRAYRLNETDLLVVDSGANRIFRMNMAGLETRSVYGFQLDPNFQPTGYPANGPLTLSDPRDATVYSNVVYYPQAGGVSLGDGESATGFEYWDHYLIADAGNHRLVEVIDRYGFDIATQRILDPIKVNGVPQIGILYWHSPAMVSGKAYAYNSVSRIALPSGQFVYVAGLGSVMPTAVDTGAVAADANSIRESATGNGGVVIFDPLLPNQPVVVNSVAIPDVTANRFWNDATGTFSSPAVPAHVKYFSNVAAVSTSFSLLGNDYVIRIMVSDSSGVYEANYVPGIGASGTTLSLNWMLPNFVYRTMRFTAGVPDGTNAADLRAVYARRVDDDNILIVNGYFGKYRNGSGPFQGEVLQLNGQTPDYTQRNFGFGSGSITLKLSPVVGTRGLVLPAFADRG